MKRIIIIITFLIFSVGLIKADDILSLKDEYYSGKNPKKAATLSLFIPGGGQYYNESYIKSAFWATTEVFFIGLTYYHYSRVVYWQDKRSEAVDESTWNNCNGHVKDQLEKRNNGYWWLGGTIILSVMDAFVDATLYNYDKEKQKIHMELSYNYIGLKYDF